MKETYSVLALYMLYLVQTAIILNTIMQIAMVYEFIPIYNVNFDSTDQPIWAVGLEALQETLDATFLLTICLQAFEWHSVAQMIEYQR